MPIKNAITLAFSSSVFFLFACSIGDTETEASFTKTFIHPNLSMADYLTDNTLAADLGKQITAEWAFAVIVVDRTGSNRRSVASCEQAFTAESRSLTPLRPAEFSAYRHALLQCRALGMAARLQAHRESFIGHLTLDKQLARRLPPSLAFTASVSEAERQRRNTALRFWADVTAIKSVNPLSEHESEYIVDGGSQTVTLLARGDMNADGIEDVLLRVVNATAGGSYRASHLFLITRADADSDFEVIAEYE